MSSRNKRRQRNYFKQGDLLKTKLDLDCLVITGKKRWPRRIKKNEKVIYMSSNIALETIWDEFPDNDGKFIYSTGPQVEVWFVHDGQMKRHVCAWHRVYQHFRLVQKV